MDEGITESRGFRFCIATDDNKGSKLQICATTSTYNLT